MHKIITVFLFVLKGAVVAILVLFRFVGLHYFQIGFSDYLLENGMLSKVYEVFLNFVFKLRSATIHTLSATEKNGSRVYHSQKFLQSI